MGAAKGTLDLTQGILMLTFTQKSHRQAVSLQPVRWESGDLLRLLGQGHDPQILTKGCGGWGKCGLH